MPEDTDALSGTALLLAIDQAIGEGLNPRLGSSFRSAVRSVLNANFGGDWDETEFAASDVGRLLSVYASKSGQTEKGIASYRSYFGRSVRLALGDVGPVEASRSRMLGAGRSGTTGQMQGDYDLLTHHFTLRPGLVTALAVPADLTAAEAERLAQFVRTLPFAS